MLGRVVRVVVFAVLALLCVTPVVAQYNPTPEYWRCDNRVSGEWAFGRAPMACDVARFISPVSVYRDYGEQVFEDSAGRRDERRRYMQALFAFVRDTADYYLTQRKNAGPAERDAWRRAVFAIAHQESFWTHYRETTSGALKMMRGDFGHGHGLMQVDDRWHFLAVNQGKGASLIQNIVYSLDEYYAAWQRAPSVWCVQRATDWRARSRAAYSAYNGGPSKICRWTNPNDRWARNDRGFLSKLDGQNWQGYVADPEAPASVDVGCLVAGNTNCQGPGASWQEDLLLLDDGRVCTFDGDTLHCLEAQRNAACLAAANPAFEGNSSLRLSAADIQGLPTLSRDRHRLCPQVADGLRPFGGFIETTASINLRATPGGTWLVTVAQGERLQVTDFEVTDAVSGERYYRVWSQGHTGYIYAGDNDDHPAWTQPATERTGGYTVPRAGDRLRVRRAGGVAMTDVPGGQTLAELAPGADFIAKGHAVFGDNNRLFHHVEFAGGEGWVFAGSFAAWPTYRQWASLEQREGEVAVACPEGAWFDDELMACRDEIDAWSLFTPAMVARCEQAGGGTPCRLPRTVNVEGEPVELLRWSVGFAESLHGGGDCPLGSERRWDHGYHCAVVAQGEVTDVLGPFGPALSNECARKGGGQACHAQRWSAGFWRWVAAVGE